MMSPKNLTTIFSPTPFDFEIKNVYFNLHSQVKHFKKKIIYSYCIEIFALY